MRLQHPISLAVAAVLFCGLAGAHGTTNRLFSSTPPPVIRVWDTGAGLPQNTVSAIVQTRDGYLWLGTSDGLVRFDGVRFTVYGLNEGLPSVDIRVLLEDQQGVMWIATAGGGLGRWHAGRVENVESVPSRVIVTTLQEDDSGRLWVGTASGLHCLRAGKPVEVPGLKIETHETPGNYIRSLLWDGKDTMWIGTWQEGLFAYHDGQTQRCPGPVNNENLYVHCLLNDRQGRLWASIGNGQLLCREDEQWRIFNENDGLPFAFITSLAEDASGTLWAGSLDAGLYWFDGARFQVIRSPDGLSADDIRSLRLDHEGNLWVGTRTGGLNRLSQRKLLFAGSHLGLTNNFTRGVAETADGNLWVATGGGSLYHGSLAGFQAFRPDPLLAFYAHVESVLAASDGSVWWGGANCLLHWKDDKIVGVYTNQPWVKSRTITALHEDKYGGLWIGNSAGTLTHYQDGLFIEQPPTVARGAITSLASAPDGTVWIGSSGGGVRRIRKGSDEVLSLPDKLASRSIRTLYFDNEGTLWIGTAGGGLACSRDGRTVNFTPDQGLPRRTVSQIVEDDFGFLWLGTYRGVFKVRKQDLLDCATGKLAFVHTRSFGINDGMFTEETSGGFCPAGLKTRSGLICISTVKGLVFFDPAESANATSLQRPVIEEMRVNDRPFPRLQNEPNSTNRPEHSRCTLPPDGRDVEIQFTAIQFSEPEKIGFRYRLAGLDAGWTEVGGRRTANYQRLAPGNYTFEVQACNANGLWNENGATLAFTVPAFFWETAWFRTLTVLSVTGLCGGIIGWVMRRRYRQRLASIKMTHAVERERVRISRDMHDHVGGMLTQVSQLSDMALGEIKDPNVLKNRIERIGSGTREAVQALDEIVWATNPKNDNLASFAEYVSQFGDEYFEATRIRCWQEMPATLPPLPLRADIRHDVFLAVREACNNVIKHSHATEVWLRISLNDHRVRIEIEDNGHGFHPGAATSGGNGLENIRARLKEEGGTAIITSTRGKGTLVRLEFPLPA